MSEAPEAVRRIAALLAAGGVEGASSEARRLIEAASSRSYGELVASGQAVAEEVLDDAEVMAARRVAGEPLQYITGVAGFRRLDLEVGPGVLVPRPETEVVAERAMAHLPHGGVLVDACTGSGAIALATKGERPDATVLATEVSESALEWAERNRARLGLDVRLIRCDLLSGLPGGLRGRLDVVVANPPYVAEADAGTLPADVVDHEPHEALFSGTEGLVAIRRLIADARGWLVGGGWLVLEMGADQAGSVTELMKGEGYSEVSIVKDLAGRDRIAEGRNGG